MTAPAAGEGARVRYTAACPCGFPDASWASVLTLYSSPYGTSALVVDAVVDCPACDVQQVAA